MKSKVKSLRFSHLREWQIGMKQKLKIIKRGENVINDKDALSSFLADFSKIKEAKILVHGGGKRASEMISELGLKPKMINGRRVTDESTLEIVTMVYAGLLNKNITEEFWIWKISIHY